MRRMTWKKPNGEWGVRGVDLSTLPPVLYGMAHKLLDFEERCESPDALDTLMYRMDDLQAENAELLTQHRTEICESGYDCVALGQLQSEIERLKAKVKQWKQVSAENFASCEKLQAALSRVEAERDAAVEENEFRKHTILTPLYTCGGHGYSDDDDENFWCPVCRQHLGTHRGFVTTCPRCGQEINSDGEPCWDYDELRRTEYDHLPKNWERGAQGVE